MVYLGIIWAVSAIGSAVIGSNKGDLVGGLVIGCLTGPVGILITLSLHGNRRTCGRCRWFGTRAELGGGNACPQCGAHVPEPYTTHIICPDPKCDYEGPPRRQARGDTFTGLLLLLLGILPGTLYFALTSGYRYLCPKCGVQIRSDN